MLSDAILPSAVTTGLHPIDGLGGIFVVTDAQIVRIRLDKGEAGAGKNC